MVPEEFMRYQWTRLPHGFPSQEFVAQVKRLIDSPGGKGAAPGNGSSAAGKALPGVFPSPGGRAHAESKAALLTRCAVAGVLIAGAAVAWFITFKPKPPAAVAPAPVAAAPAAPVVDAKSIAVLPFENFSPDAENEFFAEGLQDEVITALAKVHDLKVISRTSVMAYKNPEGRNLKKIAEDLGVACILEGSVQRSGGKVHLNAQLIDARTDAHLWADSYTNDLTDIFTLEATLAQEIAGALKANLTANETALIVRRPTQNQAAYDLYLRAVVLWENLDSSSTKNDYERVLAFHEEAESMDPAFALPHMQASIVNGSMYWFAQIDPTPERKAKALAELEATRRLAPDAPETHFAQGAYDYTCENDWAGALGEYLAAEKDLPSDGELEHRIGTCYRRLGRLQEALPRFQRASELTPNDNFIIITLVETVANLRRFPQVVELANRYNPLHSKTSDLEAFRIVAQFEIDGDRQAFIRDLEALPDNPVFVVKGFIDAMNRGDFSAAAGALADNRLQWMPNGSGAITDPVDLARAEVAWLRGRKDEARQFADKAIDLYHQRKWGPRQKDWARMGIAEAEAVAGRGDDAARDAKSALDDEMLHDAYDGINMREAYGNVLVVAGRYDEAFAVLREVMDNPSGDGPNAYRYDPVWARLKSDPRFEQILKSAKPL
jgi:TolB-like protein/Flp pilus assembly protein TadD